jgi:hypothetical protein
MLYALCIIVGIALARWLARPLAWAVRAVVFVVSVGLAVRVVAFIVPEILALNWRGVGAGAGVGLVLGLTVVGFWFYILGWRGRVAATEQDEHERARQKAIKDRQVV